MPSSNRFWRDWPSRSSPGRRLPARPSRGAPQTSASSASRGAMDLRSSHSRRATLRCGTAASALALRPMPTRRSSCARLAARPSRCCGGNSKASNFRPLGLQRRFRPSGERTRFSPCRRLYAFRACPRHCPRHGDAKAGSARRSSSGKSAHALLAAFTNDCRDIDPCGHVLDALRVHDPSLVKGLGSGMRIAWTQLGPLTWQRRRPHLC